jgi:heat shock protein HslJ
MRPALLACAALIALPLSAQASETKAPTGDWRVVQLGDIVTTAEDEVTLAFSADQISGRAGCNRYSADLRIESEFGFGPLAMTRMLCEGRPGDLEAAFVRLIEGVDGWRIEGEVLELTAGEQVILRAESAGTP